MIVLQEVYVAREVSFMTFIVIIRVQSTCDFFLLVVFF
jgi:hypothetical protein